MALAIPPEFIPHILWPFGIEQYTLTVGAILPDNDNPNRNEYPIMASPIQIIRYLQTKGFDLQR